MVVVGIFLAMTHPAAAESTAADTSTDDAVVRKTIEKSLPFIEEKGLYWIEKKKCVSCHRVSFMTWSLSAAARRGFDVDLEKVNEWIDWSIEKGIPQPEGDKPVATKNADGLSQQLLSRHEYPSNKTRDEAWSNYIDLVLAEQNDAGLWKPAGQLPGQKRELAETTDVSAAWHALALTQAVGVERDAERKANLNSAIDKATQKLNVRKDAASTEWYIARLLLALESGDDAATEVTTKELLSLQKPDGSWGWLKADPGDALATGMSLYALVKSADAGAKHGDATQRAINFLVSTQREDGSWAVKGTKEKKKTKVEETAVYWGTTWAAIALLETLPVVE
jgi:hypothetical protein